MLRSLVCIFCLFSSSLYAAETCSRTAIVNYQEVLVDTSTSQQGEGLRYYLNKDPIAKAHLDKYQQESRKRTLNAVLGTTGTGLIIAGLLTTSSKSSDFGTKELLLAGGIAVFLVNFFVSTTVKYQNEVYLHKAVKEYNKRNLPRIYFSPFKNSDEKGTNSSSNWGVTGGFSKEF